MSEDLFVLDCGSYKSCFAKTISSEARKCDAILNDENKKIDLKNWRMLHEAEDVVRLRKNTRNRSEDTRRHSLHNINSMRRITNTNRITEIPVESLQYQTKIETLEWQIKEIQRSQEMYKAVMKSVVTYLEKAHHSLEMLGCKMNRKRSKSEHHINFDATNSWKPRQDPPVPEEIPPEKLAQEAFRLLRTARSLLNTQEPDLVKIQPELETDHEFLAQVAKEFPSNPITLTPKLLLPETEFKISTALNRKLSLQLNEVRRNSKVFRSSLAESETEATKNVKETHNGSISSVEDESGFSSMNSFQEIGLPIADSTVIEEVQNSCHKKRENNVDDVKLWAMSPQHKRWYSTPTDNPDNCSKSLKVLWV